MESLRPNFWDVNQWEIMETKTVHDFTDSDWTFEAIRVKIGTLFYESVDINQHYVTNKTPIIRWITRKQYDYLMNHTGSVIW